MPTLQCGDYRVWFGTDDAPAPSGAIPHARELTARVGVLPDDPQLMVRIRYRRQGGAWMTLPTRALPKQGDETPRYYDGVFRDLAPGAVSSTPCNVSARAGSSRRARCTLSNSSSRRGHRLRLAV